jgi:hypothetical protein
MSRPSLFDDDKPSSKVSDPRLNQPLMADSSYNLRMKEEQQKKQIEERVQAINELRKVPASTNMNYVDLMNWVEKLLHACGGEAKANFIEVSRDFMKLATRVPMKANLHQFLPEDDKNNPRFHKVVTQILLTTSLIEGIRWVPTPEGTFLILSVKKDIL